MKDRHPKKKTKKKADNRSIAAKKATKNVKTKVKSKNIDRAELYKAMRIKGLDLTGLKRGGKVSGKDANMKKKISKNVKLLQERFKANRIKNR